jgi:sugar phosphate isomerase/epimerase
VQEAIETLGDRIRSVHVHDNHGVRDEHLWPGDGTIDWPRAAQALRALANPPMAVLEIHYSINEPQEALQDRIQKAFDRL